MSIYLFINLKKETPVICIPFLIAATTAKILSVCFALASALYKKKRWKWRSLIFAYGNVYALRVHEYNKNNENDKTSICSYVCRYICWYIQTNRHVSMSLSHSRGLVCLPIFVAIVVLQALTYTCTIWTSKALLSLSLTHTHTQARILVWGFFCICRWKTWIAVIVNFSFFSFLIDLYLIGSIVL